jgi:hypothetical protein
VSCFEEEEEEEEEEIRVIYLVDIEDWGGRWSQCSCREYATLRSWYTERNDTEVRRVSGDMDVRSPGMAWRLTMSEVPIDTFQQVSTSILV